LGDLSGKLRIGDSRYGRDAFQRLRFRVKGDLCMTNREKLGQEVKRYGYAKKKKVKLYGKKLEVVSDPVNSQDDNIFVEAREEGADHVRRVQVPRNVVEMAKQVRRNETK